MNAELMYAILAMDAYNRGYDAGINTLPTITGAEIGNATINVDSSIFQSGADRLDDNIGFYALAYNYGDQTIISYRGTDYPRVDVLRDISNGWILGAGDLSHPL